MRLLIAEDDADTLELASTLLSGNQPHWEVEDEQQVQL